jgi:hypothetical protein
LDGPTLYSRRAALRLGLLGGAGLAAAALIGCGDDDDETPAAVPTTPPAAGGNGENVLSLVSGWYRDRQVRYYDFGDRTKLTQGSSIAVAPIFALITGMDGEGNPQFVEGQHNIVDVVPGDAGYSDLWQVVLVTVPADYAPDTLKSAAEVSSSGYGTMTTDIFVNCPIVEEGTQLEGGEPLVQGWNKGEAVFYPDFGPNPAIALPIWAFITGMDASGTPQFVDGQMNIIDSVPADQGYSAFWRVNLVTVPADYEANSIKSAADVRAAGHQITETDIVVNCPVVEVA